MDMCGAGRLRALTRSGAPSSQFTRCDCDMHPSTFKSNTTDKQHARTKVQVKCGSTPTASRSSFPHVLVNCGGQGKSEYLMERILSTTFGKHSNFWSGNRLIITNSTDTAMDLYKAAKNSHIPSAHVFTDMPDDAQTALYNALRKTEADVTHGRQPFLAIFVARSNLKQLWPVLIDCIVSFDATLDCHKTCECVQACSGDASKHHGVKAFIHLYEGKADTYESQKRALVQQDLTVKMLSASKGRKAIALVTDHDS